MWQVPLSEVNERQSESFGMHFTSLGQDKSLLASAVRDKHAELALI